MSCAWALKHFSPKAERRLMSTFARGPLGRDLHEPLMDLAMLDVKQYRVRLWAPLTSQDVRETPSLELQKGRNAVQVWWAQPVPA